MLVFCFEMYVPYQRVVGIRPRAVWLGVRISAGTKNFSLLQKRLYRLYAALGLLLSGYQGAFLWVMRPEREVDHLVLMLRMSGAIPLLPLQIFMALTETTLL